MIWDYVREWIVAHELTFQWWYGFGVGAGLTAIAFRTYRRLTR